MRDREQQGNEDQSSPLEQTPNSFAIASANMHTKPPRRTTNMKRSLNCTNSLSDPSSKMRRVQEVSPSPFPSKGPGSSGNVGERVRNAIGEAQDKIAAGNPRANDAGGYHNSSVSHILYREDRKHSSHNVFTQKWYDGLQESIAKKRFEVPKNVLMPAYFAIEDHLHNSLFSSSGAESEEADLLYQVLAFVQNISNEFLHVMGDTEKLDVKAPEKHMMHIWKKIRGVSEMLETRYDLLLFRRRGYKLQAKMLESYCVPPVGDSILAKTVFREVRNVGHGEDAVVSAEYARTKATRISIPKPLRVPSEKGNDKRNLPESSVRHEQLGDDPTGGSNVALHLQNTRGKQCKSSNPGIINSAENVAVEVIGEECSVVHEEDFEKSRYRETQIPSHLLSLHGLARIPGESKPILPLAMSRVLVEQMRKDERDGVVAVPPRPEWQSVQVVALSDEKEQSKSNIAKPLPRLQMKTQESLPPKNHAVERGVEVVQRDEHVARPSPTTPRALPRVGFVPVQCVSTLLTHCNTIAFTYVIGEEQRRSDRHLVACPSWGGFKWSLLVFPHGDQKKHTLAVFLKCLGRENGGYTADWKAGAKFGIGVAKRSSPVYCCALDGGRDATVVNNACNKVLKMLACKDSRRMDEPYFGASQYLFRAKSNNRGFPALAPTSELNTGMFCNEEGKMVLFGYISEVVSK